MEVYLVVGPLRWQLTDYLGLGHVEYVYVLPGTVYLPSAGIKLVRPKIQGGFVDVCEVGPTEFNHLLELGKFGLDGSKVRLVEVDESLVKRVIALSNASAKSPKEFGLAVNSLCETIPSA